VETRPYAESILRSLLKQHLPHALKRLREMFLFKQPLHLRLQFYTRF